MRLFRRRARAERTAGQSTEELIAALRDDDPDRREAAAYRLGVTEDEQAVEPLLDVFRSDNNIAVRGAVALSLGRLGDRRALAPLLESIAGPDPHPGLTSRVATALGDLGDPAAEDVLRRMAEDPESLDIPRRAAADALEVLAGGQRRPERPEDLEGSEREGALASKAEYRRSAINWWQHTDRNEAICDDCNSTISRDEGYLRPGYFACEPCTDKMVSGYYS